jgi:hypothetical protein
LAFGGIVTAAVACTESYNGSSWTAGGAMGIARYRLAGAGESNTAALGFSGGYNLKCTESYNGSTWTAGSIMSSGRRYLAGAGTNTAALAFGGFCNSGGCVACTELYNAGKFLKQKI